MTPTAGRPNRRRLNRVMRYPLIHVACDSPATLAGNRAADNGRSTTCNGRALRPRRPTDREPPRVLRRAAVPSYSDDPADKRGAGTDHKERFSANATAADDTFPSTMCVGPNSDTTGRSNAAAKWRGPLSVVTSRSAAPDTGFRQTQRDAGPFRVSRRRLIRQGVHGRVPALVDDLTGQLAFGRPTQDKDAATALLRQVTGSVAK